MLSKLKSFFDDYLAPSQQQDPEHATQLATAVLLVELSRADAEVAGSEQRAVARTLKSRFDLSEGEVDGLLTLADEAADEATSLFQFTRLLNDHFSAEQKIQVVEMLWQVAYSDGRLDVHEDHTIRKIADLLYVPHPAFIKAKHRANPNG